MNKKYLFSILFSEMMDMYEIKPEKFAEAVGVDSSTVRHWKSGRLPRVYSLKPMIDAINKEVLMNTDIYKNEATMSNIKNFLCNRNEVPKTEKEYIVKEKKIDKFVEFVLRRSFENKIQVDCTETIFKDKETIPNHVNELLEEIKQTKIIFFDFDGTLTKTNELKTTWERLWCKLGYTSNDCSALHARFSRKEIDHAEWCSITEKMFIERGLNKQMIKEVAENIKLIEGFDEVIPYLRDNNILLYIVSGSINVIIREVLGAYCEHFEGISANRFIFNKDNVLEKIVGTKFDFEGKAQYIKNIMNDMNVLPEEVLFIGNSLNDTMAYLSGARTLCINPIHTNYTNYLYWKHFILECQNLKEIYPYVGGIA